MRLPDIKSGGVGGFAIRQGNVRARTRIAERGAEAGVGVAIGKAISAIANDIYDRQMIMETEKAQSYRLEQEAILQEEHGPDRKFYAPNELPDELQSVRPAEDPSQVGILQERPAHEVQHELKYRRRQEIANEAAEFIQDPDGRANFLAATNKVNASQYLRDIRESQIKQIEHRRDSQDAMFTQLLNGGQYKAAEYIGQEFEGTQEEKNARVHRAKTRAETDPMDYAIANQDVGMMEAQLGEMTKPPDEYGGELIQEQRREWANRLRTEIYKAQKADRDLLKANRQVWRYEGDQYITALKSGGGGFIDKDESDRIKSNLIISGQPTDMIKLRQIDFYERAQPTLSWLSRQPPSLRQRAIQETSKQLQGTTESYLMKEFLDNSVSEMNRKQFSNSAEYGIDNGITRPVPFDIENLDATLEALNKNDHIVYDNIGSSTGLFSRAQEVQWADFVKKTAAQTEDQLPELFSMVESALGVEAYKAYEPIKDEVGTLAVAGQIWADNPSGSQLIVRGRRLRNEYDNVLDDIEDTFNAAISEKLGLIYKNRRGQHSVRAEAIKDVYVAMKMNEGQKNVTSPFVKFDEDTFEEAERIVTGGIVEVNGQKVEPAYTGQTQNELEDFMVGSNNFTKNELKAMGGKPYGFSGNKLRSEAQDGNIEFYSLGRNTYGMYYIPTDQWVFDETTGNVFEFKFNRGSPDIIPEVVESQTKEQMVQQAIEFDREQFRNQVKSLGESIKKYTREINRVLQKPIGEFFTEEE